MDKIRIIILAAGKGTRMKSELPKVLAPLRGRHMIQHLLDSVKKAWNGKPVIVVGYQADVVKRELGSSYTYVVQEELLGTGYAVSCTEVECKSAEHVVVLSGDQPFISSETILKLIKKHSESGAEITFTTTELSDFTDWRKAFLHFGRVIRSDSMVVGVREYKDATEEEKNITEVNAGCYAFKGSWLWENLKKIGNKNAQSEYYLTDLFKIASENSQHKNNIESIQIDPREALGANSKEELEILEKML